MTDGPAPSPEARAARVAAFASAAALSTAQDLVRTVLPALGDGLNPELVAEETLVLVAAATARACEVGLRADPTVRDAVAAALDEVPFLYHDYLLGAEMVARGAEGDVEVDQSVYTRLARKAEFYAGRLPSGRFPGPAALGDVLPLWMGRVSPPKLPTTPQQRLGELGLDDLLSTHLRLVLAFAQREAGAVGS